MSEEKADYNPADHMLNLKGKEYLPVAARIVWLRRDHPDAQIRTILTDHNPQEGTALYRAEVTLPSGGHAEATATQSRKQFGDYLEKCETKAIGRALGFLGYGTMAAFEDEPGNPLYADAPVDRPRQQPTGQQRHQAARATGLDPATNDAPLWSDIDAARQREARQPAPAAPTADLFTASQFDRTINRVWELLEDGKPYEQLVGYLQAARPSMTEQQREVVRLELPKLKAACDERGTAQRTPAPASVAG